MTLKSLFKKNMHNLHPVITGLCLHLNFYNVNVIQMASVKISDFKIENFSKIILKTYH